MEGVVKFKDVPKGQKLQYTWDYWRLPAIIVILIVLFLGVIFYTIFSTPKVDMNVLLTCKYTLDENHIAQVESDMKNAYEHEKNKNYQITYIQINEEMSKINPTTHAAEMTRLRGEIASPDSYVYLLDDDMFNEFKSEGLIATYRELGLDSDEDIKISADKIFTNPNFKGKFYLCLRPKNISQLDSKKNIEKYEYALNFIKNVNSK